MKQNTQLFLTLWISLFITLWLMLSLTSDPLKLLTWASHSRRNPCSFEALKPGLQTLPTGTEKLTLYALQKLTHNSQTIKLPKALRQDRQPRVVFLSASDGETPALVRCGAGRGLLQATHIAIKELHNNLTHREYRKFRHLKLDIVTKVTRHSFLNDDKTPTLFQKGLLGLALPKRYAKVWLPGQLMVLAQRQPIRDLRARHIRSLFPHSKSPKFFYVFATQSYITSGHKVASLYRGHRMFRNITPTTLLTAARMAGKYLIRSVQPSGKFVYTYHPTTHRKSRRYNILRHAGTTYSMLELYQATREPKILRAAQRALGYLKQKMKPSPLNQSHALSLVERGVSKLGGNGLALVALTQYMYATKSKEGLSQAKKLATDIALRQRKNGSFTHIYDYPSGRAHRFISGYYPGEAILGLMRLYRLDRKKLWLETAKQAANYLILVRDKSKTRDTISHDHWLLYGLNELYRYIKDPIYLQHARKIVRAIHKRQNHHTHPLDWRGSYNTPPRSTPTATRSEGLCAAYTMLKKQSSLPQQQKLILALKQGISFQLQTQFRLENTLYFPHPREALGAFASSLTQSHIRIDYVQHNLSSLLCLRRILQRQTRRSSHGQRH